MLAPTFSSVRESDLLWLLGRLRSAQSVALIGWPGVGKSTLLKQLHEHATGLANLGLLPAHIDCRRFEPEMGAPQFWRQVLFANESLAEQLASVRKRLEAESYEPLTLHSVLLRSLGTRRILLLLDHAEALVEHGGLRSMLVHGGLRALSNDREAPLRLVLACRRDIEELNRKLARPGGSPLFNHLEVRRLALLSDEQIRTMFAQGAPDATLAGLSEAALDVIVDQAGGHPGVARMLAQLMSDVGPQSPSHGVALARAQHLCLPVFDEIMASLPDNTRGLLLQLAQSQVGPVAIDNPRLVDLGLLAQRGPSMYIRSPLLASYLVGSVPQTSGVATGQVPRWYCIFADEDRRTRDDLLRRLQPRIDFGKLRYWDRAMVAPGAITQVEMQRHRESAEVIVFLRSPAVWSAPDCIADVAWLSSQAAAVDGLGMASELRIAPILVRSDANFGHPLQHLQALPGEGKSIREYRSSERAWDRVLQGLMQLADGDPTSR